MTQNTRHPHKFGKKFIRSTDVGLVQQRPTLIEHLADIAEVDIPED